ncbi:hypothetical protein CRM22_000169 [Opisthorchis felineus]|uniref:XK-related protein n=1 Tax=Opisthorchis felineus TaxID=147828 RepID=A0A4S2MG96_OPIFE|nr:hypothetical protein CRM22_000169 [Opisthorchis felineus]
MFRAETGEAHNSENVPAATTGAGQSAFSCKSLVTRRSWLAPTTWARFPNRRPTLQVRHAIPLEEKDSPAAWVGDFVDTAVPLRQVEPTPSVCRSTPETRTYAGARDDNQAVLLEFLRVHGFRPYQLVLFLFSILTYVSDICSDAYLVYAYHRQGDYYWSYMTLALLIIPAMVMTAFSLAWYVLDRKVNVDPPRTCRVWTLRLFFHGLQLAPIVRLADAVYYGLASRRAELSLAMAVQYTQLMLYEDADSAMLRMIECFMEAAPQLLLQLYIIITQGTPEHKFQLVAQIVSCFTSWLSLSWSLTHYQTALRRSRVEKANLTWLGSVLFFLWKSLMLASRILALALFAAIVQGMWFGLGLGLHWLLSVGWLVTRGTTFCSPNPRTFTEFLFDMVLGAVYCFDVVNVREGHSRLWYLTCYTTIGLENLLATFLWLVFSSAEVTVPLSPQHKWMLRPSNLSSWIRSVPQWVLPVCVIGSFILGVWMMLTYYVFAHPSKNIKMCVPCDVLFDCNAVLTIPSIAPVPPMDTKASEATETPNDAEYL